ncbi:potassium/sodium hyperpolarization-activated cyclic nucleotide-gated channel 3-like [Diorhabda carinulata]|uniref:potassium/sodium hyperpolarization-activated cyclic nucleotide-gated channel 3-like n=1 Tax=Diorhabda carinulata TaxID=1163345 RepID=UPI0025A12910|nr:potassium/sodium hyperpolarization-activated cyclic nucleotide-gated channel 3-like [Diorhabda carinulata]
MRIFPDQNIAREHCLTYQEVVTSRTNEKEIVQYIFNSGAFIQIKRWFFYRMTINSKHPTTLIYFKSSSSRKNEQTRHLMHYKNTIHPFSMMNLFWEYVMAWVYLYMLITYFLSSLYIFDEYLKLGHIRRTIGDFIYLLDMIHFFFEGYYNALDHRTVLSHRYIARRYLKSYFIIDVIALLPNISLIAYLITWSPKVIYMRYFGLIRIFRLKRLLNAFDLIKNYKDYTSYHLKAIKCVLIYFAIVTFLYSMIFILSYHIDRFSEIYVVHDSNLDFLSTTLILFMVSQGLEPLYTQWTILLITICYFCALFIHLFLHAQVYQVWNTFFSVKSKNEDLLNQFKEYVRYRGLPEDLKKRILLYFKFKFQNNFYNERHINYIVSNSIKEEIMCNIVHKYLVKAYILKTLPRNILLKVVTKLKSEIFLPDDIVVIAGKPAQNIYFIYYGQLAVYNRHGIEIAHIEDGDCFGEMDTLFYEVQSYTVVAITPCELFSLSREAFMEIIDKNIELKKRVMAEAKVRLLAASNYHFN